MTIVMREALAGARQRARDELQPAPCPACEAAAFSAQRARQMVLDGLSDPPRARLYSEHGGICLTHFLEAAPVLDRSTLKPLAEPPPEILGRDRSDADSSHCSAGPITTPPPCPLARPSARSLRRRRLDARTALRSPWDRGLPGVPLDRDGGPSLRSLAHRARRAERPVAPERPGRAVRRPPPRSGAHRPSAGRSGDRAQTRGHDGQADAGAREGSATSPDTARRGRGAPAEELDTVAPRDRHEAVLPGLQRARRNRAFAARSRGCGARATDGARPLRAQPRAVPPARGADFRRSGGPAGTTPRGRATRSARLGGGRDRSQVRLGLPPRGAAATSSTRGYEPWPRSTGACSRAARRPSACPRPESEPAMTGDVRTTRAGGGRDARRPNPRRGRAGRHREASGARARAVRAAGRRPRPDRGLPGAGQDADRAIVRDRDRHRGSRACSSRRT